jgi:HEAT repeat protein
LDVSGAMPNTGNRHGKRDIRADHVGLRRLRDAGLPGRDRQRTANVTSRKLYTSLRLFQLCETMTRAPQDDPPAEYRIPVRLRRKEIVRSALQRLASQGNVEAADIQALALDTRLPFDLRRDAIVIVLAAARPNEELLRDLLQSGDRFTATETLKIIKYLGTEWALPELATGARTSDDPSQRSLFAWALAAYPTNSVAEGVLIEILASDSAAIVRDHAIESLGEFPSPRVVEALVQVLERGGASERFWALFSLGNLANPNTREAISQCLQDQTVIPGYGTIAEEAKAALIKIEHGGRWL